MQGEGEYLTLMEASKVLRVSMSWLYKKAKANIVPHYRVGGLIRFTEKDLENWMNAHKIKGCQKV